MNKSLKVGASSYVMYAETNGANLNPYGFLSAQNPLAKAYDDKGGFTENTDLNCMRWNCKFEPKILSNSYNLF